MRIKNPTFKQKDDWQAHEWLRTILTLAVFFGFLTLALHYAIVRDHRQEQSNLCQWAKESGNENHQAKCECFYNGEDISCVK